MRRNLDRRIEALVPVTSGPMIAHIRDVILDAYLRDTHDSWAEQQDGTYRHLRQGKGFSAQEFLIKHSSARSLLSSRPDGESDG
jgi:polyphosphate kinase